jgi:hypothetical protein
MWSEEPMGSSVDYRCAREAANLLPLGRVQVPVALRPLNSHKDRESS